MPRNQRFLGLSYTESLTRQSTIGESLIGVGGVIVKQPLSQFHLFARHYGVHY